MILISLCGCDGLQYTLTSAINTAINDRACVNMS